MSSYINCILVLYDGYVTLVCEKILSENPPVTLSKTFSQLYRNIRGGSCENGKVV